MKVAIQTGASLVPVVGFGENELFHTVDNTTPGLGQLLYKAQLVGMSIFMISFPVFTHLMPKREKVTVVVGSPIDTEHLKCEEPSQEIIDKVHQDYCKQLEKLWNDHKDEYGKSIPIDIS